MLHCTAALRCSKAFNSPQVPCTSRNIQTFSKNSADDNRPKSICASPIYVQGALVNVDEESRLHRCVILGARIYFLPPSYRDAWMRRMPPGLHDASGGLSKICVRGMFPHSRVLHRNDFGRLKYPHLYTLRSSKPMKTIVNSPHVDVNMLGDIFVCVQCSVAFRDRSEDVTEIGL